jgi:iron complex outermembrane receptor protein
VALDYHVNRDVLLYASASKGYKAGGYNSRALGGTPPLSYNPEFLTAYELGLKTTLFDGRMTFNVAGFYNDYKDIQLLSVVDLGGGYVETTIQNAAKGRILGGEIEIQAEPVDDLVLGLGVGILDTKYNNVGAEAQASGILPTNRFINAPKLTMNMTADYSFDIGKDQKIKLHGDANYKSSQFRDAINTPALRADSYWILNGRVAWAPNQTFELAAFVTNITDEVYLTNGVNVGGLGYVEAYYSRPREWGISASAKF